MLSEIFREADKNDLSSRALPRGLRTSTRTPAYNRYESRAIYMNAPTKYVQYTSQNLRRATSPLYKTLYSFAFFFRFPVRPGLNASSLASLSSRLALSSSYSPPSIPAGSSSSSRSNSPRLTSLILSLASASASSTPWKAPVLSPLTRRMRATRAF